MRPDLCPCILTSGHREVAAFRIPIVMNKILGPLPHNDPSYYGLPSVASVTHLRHAADDPSKDAEVLYFGPKMTDWCDYLQLHCIARDYLCVADPFCSERRGLGLQGVRCAAVNYTDISGQS